MTQITHRFVVCLSNEGYPASLEVRKIYPVLPDADAEEHDMLRVVDESDEDYIFPSSRFAPITLPSEVEDAFRVATCPFFAPSATRKGRMENLLTPYRR